MFRNASLRLSSFQSTRLIPTVRCFGQITTDFVAQDLRGNLITKKVPIVVGDPGEAYVLIEPELGSVLRAASPRTSTSSATGEKCQLTFFHDSLYFGFGPSSYPRLYVPAQMPRQTESNTSPATIILSGKMHEIVIDGTFDATFAEMAKASARKLATVLDQLKDM